MPDNYQINITALANDVRYVIDAYTRMSSSPNEDDRSAADDDDGNDGDGATSMEDLVTSVEESLGQGGGDTDRVDVAGLIEGVFDMNWRSILM